MKHQNVKDILKDLDLSEEDQASFIGLFYVGNYKIILESILAVNGSDQKMVTQIKTFFENLIAQIPENKREILELIIESENAKLATQMLEGLKELIPDENQQQLSLKIETLKKSLVAQQDQDK